MIARPTTVPPIYSEPRTGTKDRTWGRLTNLGSLTTLGDMENLTESGRTRPKKETPGGKYFRDTSGPVKSKSPYSVKFLVCEDFCSSLVGSCQTLCHVFSSQTK